MIDIDKLDALSLIKILCIKQDRLDKTPWYRPFKRRRLMKDRNEIITRFLNECDIFEQANAICGILQGFKVNIHQISMLYAPMQYISVWANTVEFKLVSGYDHVLRTGKVVYDEVNNEFVVDIDPIPMGANGYSFKYAANIPLANKFKRLWDQDIEEPLEVLFMDALQCIVHVVNSPMYNMTDSPAEHEYAD